MKCVQLKVFSPDEAGLAPVSCDDVPLGNWSEMQRLKCQVSSKRHCTRIIIQLASDLALLALVLTVKLLVIKGVFHPLSMMSSSGKDEEKNPNSKVTQLIFNKCTEI